MRISLNPFSASPPNQGPTHPVRSGTADIMRMLAMLLVVAGHSQWLSKGHPEAHRFIYLFHMPVFFFVSGCVFKSKPFVALLSNRAERLLVPYLSVSILATVYYLYTKRPFSVDNPWAGLLWATGQSIPWVPLWFLPTLFLVTAGHAVVATVQSRKQFGPWFLAAAIAALVVVQSVVSGMQITQPMLDNFGRPLGWPWGLDLLPICMAYFAMGALFKSLLAPPPPAQTVQWFGTTPAALTAGGFALALAVFMVMFNRGALLDLNMRELQPFAGAIVASVSGIVVVLFASRLLASSATLSAWAAAFSEKIMVIFLFHQVIQSALLRALPADRFSSAAVAYAAAILVPMLVHTLVVQRSAMASFLLGGGRRAPSPAGCY